MESITFIKHQGSQCDLSKGDKEESLNKSLNRSQTHAGTTTVSLQFMNVFHIQWLLFPTLETEEKTSIKRHATSSK